MSKYRNINESDIERLSNIILETESQTEELDEILSGTKAGDFFQGVRGFMKGESFGYFKFLSKIKNRSQKVIKELDDIEKFMEELKELKPRVDKLSIAPEKKMRLLKLLDFVITKWEPFFPGYKKALGEINLLSTEKLSGQRLDVVPGSKRAQIGKDLMMSKDEMSPEEDLSKPEVVDFDTTTTTTTKKPTNPLTTTGETKGTEEKKKEENLKEEIDRFKQLIK